MSELKRARDILYRENRTCVLCQGEVLYTSDLRGVKPLVQWYEGDIDFTDFSAADKVVGRGAAFLYVLLKVKEVYAGVISEAALSLLEAKGIHTEYGRAVQNIINRRGDGICPFEEAVLNITEEETAYKAIKNKMKELNIT